MQRRSLGTGGAGAGRLGAALPALVLRVLLVLLLSDRAASGAPIDTSAPASASGHWRVLDALPSRGEALAALATSARGGVAVGDVAGVSWWSGGSWSRAQTPAVRDLAFDGDGRLWIGTQEGLFVWAPEARPQRRTLRDGDASGRVSRIEAKRDVVVVATEAGAYWSSSGGAWQTLNAGSADQPVRWIALRRAGAGGVGLAEPGAAPELAEVWSYGAEGLVRTRGVEASAGLRIVDRLAWPLPRPLVEAGAVDLVLDRDETRLAVVYADAIAVLELEGSDPRAVRWRWVRPVLPPGASIRRLVFGAGASIWLATDHGLHTAASLDGPFSRVANPAGSRECTDVAEGIATDVAQGNAGSAADGAALPAGARAIALCRTVLLALVDAVHDGRAAETAERAPKTGADRDRAPEPAPIELPADPPVASIRDRALVRVGLAIERADSLWRGLRARALLPSLQLRGAWDDDLDRGRSHNQTFVSGDTRSLRDRDRDEGRHYGAAVVLDWELGGLAYPDQSVDLYRELRQVTSLRDDVSDEIHQLYFERQRIRARLARPEALAPGEAVELTLRAEELDAGLDAWTGGWIRAWRAARASADPPIHPRRFEASND